MRTRSGGYLNVHFHLSHVFPVTQLFCFLTLELLPIVVGQALIVGGSVNGTCNGGY